MLSCLLLLGTALVGSQMPLPEPIEATAPVLPPQAPPASPPPPTPPPAPADRWPLMRELQGTYLGVLLDDNRLRLSGWADLSFTSSTDRFDQLPMGFNYLANNFLLQQNWLRFERTVVTSGTSEPTFGFRSDTILPGSDYRFTLARGIFNGQLSADNGQPARYGIDPIQFYGEAYFPSVAGGVDVKLGRFFAQYGVESNEAVSNALASHAYTFIYDPFTHTGLLTTTKLTPALSVQAGLVLGSDVFIDPADELTCIGSVKWAPPDGRDSVLFSVILGPGRFNAARNFNNPEIFDLVYTHLFSRRLSYNFESLYGFQTGVPGTGFANWLGVLNYVTYTFTPRTSGTVRLELFDDAQGQRTGFAGLYSAVTAGVTFKPRPEVIFRPELRYDYNDESRPFQNHHGVLTATADVIFRW
jgi:Putative beta-barrel porin-2, OmpL-like. bbp2